MPAVTRPWFEKAFGRGYLAVYPHRDLASARREVAALVDQGVAGRTLDLGCGFGRHSLAFAEQGLEVVGLDLSAELLGHAEAFASGSTSTARVTGRLVRGDVRSLPLRDRSFDTVCMLFSSFGYFDDEANRGVLAELSRILRPKGRVVLDLMNPTRVRASLVPQSTTERDGFVLHETRMLTDEGRRVVKDVRLVETDGAVRTWHEDVRLYEAQELAELAQAVGLRVVRTHGEFDGAAFGPDAARQIAWLEPRSGG